MVLLLQAYRLEPLILKHYSTIMPLRVHHHDSPKKAHYDKMPALAFSALKTRSASYEKGGTKNGKKEDGGKKEEESEKKKKEQQKEKPLKG